MKIIELFETGPNLADALRAAAQQKMAASQPKMGQPTDPNAVKQGQSTQGTQGTAAPSQATTGGTTTPQNGVKGIGASFISGLTKGKADSLSGLGNMAKQGVKNIAANQLGMKNTVAAVGSNTAQQPAQIQKPEDLGMALRPGSEIDLPNVGKIKVTKSNAQGIELDTSQAPSLGIPKLTHTGQVRISGLTERDQVLAQNLVRKGIYEISKDSEHIFKRCNEKDPK